MLLSIRSALWTIRKISDTMDVVIKAPMAIQMNGSISNNEKGVVFFGDITFKVYGIRLRSNLDGNTHLYRGGKTRSS